MMTKIRDDEWELVSKVDVLHLQTRNPKGNSPSKDTSFICDLSLIPQMCESHFGRSLHESNFSAHIIFMQKGNASSDPSIDVTLLQRSGCVPALLLLDVAWSVALKPGISPPLPSLR